MNDMEYQTLSTGLRDAIENARDWEGRMYTWLAGTVAKRHLRTLGVIGDPQPVRRNAWFGSSCPGYHTNIHPIDLKRPSITSAELKRWDSSIEGQKHEVG